MALVSFWAQSCVFAEAFVGPCRGPAIFFFFNPVRPKTSNRQESNSNPSKEKRSSSRCNSETGTEWSPSEISKITESKPEWPYENHDSDKKDSEDDKDSAKTYGSSQIPSENEAVLSDECDSDRDNNFEILVNALGQRIRSIRYHEMGNASQLEELTLHHELYSDFVKIKKLEKAREKVKVRRN